MNKKELHTLRRYRDMLADMLDDVARLSMTQHKRIENTPLNLRKGSRYSKSMMDYMFLHSLELRLSDIISMLTPVIHQRDMDS